MVIRRWDISTGWYRISATMIFISSRGPVRRQKPNVARHHDRDFIESVKHHEGHGQEPGESVINVKRQWPEYTPDRGRRFTSLLRTSWSLLPLILLEESTKAARLFGDRNKSEVDDGVIRVGRLGQ